MENPLLGNAVAQHVQPHRWLVSAAAHLLQVGKAARVIVDPSPNSIGRARHRLNVGQLAGRLILARLGPLVFDPVPLPAMVLAEQWADYLACQVLDAG